MKFTTLFFLISTIAFFQDTGAQSTCSELLNYVTSKGYGSTYYSSDSDAISKVTFYNVTDDNYNTYYFAVVRFTSSYTDYIYQVGSNTKTNYSMNYNSSAGKAFWTYIEPYSDVLNCGP